jgi:hypothetical protein
VSEWYGRFHLRGNVFRNDFHAPNGLNIQAAVQDNFVALDVIPCTIVTLELLLLLKLMSCIIQSYFWALTDCFQWGPCNGKFVQNSTVATMVQMLDKEGGRKAEGKQDIL